jgi:hypothetical protein
MLCCLAPTRGGLIVAHLEHAPSSLHPAPDTPTAQRRRSRGSRPRIRSRSLRSHPAHPRWRHRPAIGAAILVQPSVHLRKPLAKTAGRHRDLDANGEAPFGPGDHLARVTRHRLSLSFDSDPVSLIEHIENIRKRSWDNRGLWIWTSPRPGLCAWPYVRIAGTWRRCRSASWCGVSVNNIRSNWRSSACVARTAASARSRPSSYRCASQVAAIGDEV